MAEPVRRYADRRMGAEASLAAICKRLGSSHVPGVSRSQVEEDKEGQEAASTRHRSGWAKAARRAFGGPELGMPRLSADEFTRPLDRYTQWWEPSHERLIAASGGLLAAQGPRALEQATAELVGTELYNAVRDERSGLRFDTWAMELVDRATKRMVDSAGRQDDSWRARGGSCTVLLPLVPTDSAVTPGSRHRRQLARYRAMYRPPARRG
jgi:hypothetical protein